MSGPARRIAFVGAIVCAAAIALVATLLLLGRVGVPPFETNDQILAFRKLEGKRGLTQDQVSARLGDPTQVIAPGATGGPEPGAFSVPGGRPAAGGTWVYVSDHPYVICYVLFDRGGTVDDVIIDDRY